ncbi:MAG: hypothetical protein ACLQVI_33840 [Polyangiaceae bacterium]
MALAACSPGATEAAPVTFGSIPSEPTGAGAVSDSVFGLDQSQEGVVNTSNLRAGDGGLAWCTSPSPEQLSVATDLSPNTTLRLYSGGCIPSDGYYRACNDAGLPIYAPTCDATNSGKRIEITTSGHPVVAMRADSLDIVRGPGPNGTWAVGPSTRAILVSIGTKERRSTHVAAVELKPDEWHDPADDFAEVVPNLQSGSFTFWRKAVCVESLGCAIARWEASRSGIRISGTEKDLYLEASSRLHAEMGELRSAASVCPREAILTAARIYTLARVSGDDEKRAMKEFDGLVSGLGMGRCPASPGGRPKPLSVIRRDLAAGVRKLLASKGGGRQR